MTIFTPTNLTRVSKIVDILDLLEKSIRSNKATREDLQGLMEPAITRIEEIWRATPDPALGIEAPQDTVPSPRTQDKPKASMTLSERVDDLSLNQLCDLIYKATLRIEDLTR